MPPAVTGGCFGGILTCLLKLNDDNDDDDYLPVMDLLRRIILVHVVLIVYSKLIGDL